MVPTEFIEVDDNENTMTLSTHAPVLTTKGDSREEIKDRSANTFPTNTLKLSEYP